MNSRNPGPRHAASLLALATVAFAPLAHAGPKDWVAAGQDAGGQRFSRAVQITPANVGQLKEAWVYHLQTRAAPTAGAAAGRGLRASESIPLVIGDTLYLGSPYGRVLALDAVTGKERWTFDLPDDDAPSMRGITYWNGAGGRLRSCSAAGWADSIR